MSEGQEYEDICTTDYVDKVIGESEELARVFLAINGKNSIMKISERLGIPFEKVQRYGKILEENKLVYILNIPPGKSVVYGKPRWIIFRNIDDHIRVRFWIKDL